MLELIDIHKELAGRPVLCGISLTVERGHTQVVVGASGAGKSVTLQHIVGLLEPDSGMVRVAGCQVNHRKPRELEAIRERCGMLFQSGALINWMTVFDNIALPLRERTRMDERDIAHRVREVLDMVELDDVEDKMPDELSGGMKKRAGLARAIIRNPEVILYDEPTSGLDPVLSRSIDALIRNLQHRLTATSVVVTHDLQSALGIGDRIAMLHQGRIVCNATPEDFRQNQDPIIQAFVQAQLGPATPTTTSETAP